MPTQTQLFLIWVLIIVIIVCLAFVLLGLISSRRRAEDEMRRRWRDEYSATAVKALGARLLREAHWFADADKTLVDLLELLGGELVSQGVGYRWEAVLSMWHDRQPDKRDVEAAHGEETRQVMYATRRRLLMGLLHSVDNALSYNTTLARVRSDDERAGRTRELTAMRNELKSALIRPVMPHELRPLHVFYNTVDVAGLAAAFDACPVAPTLTDEVRNDAGH